jgi:hypothetical protein
MSHLESANKRENLIMLLPSNTFSITKCANLLAVVLARDCYEGVQTCFIWIWIVGSYRKAIVGGTLKFLGRIDTFLLVPHWKEHCWDSLVAYVQLVACQIANFLQILRC